MLNVEVFGFNFGGQRFAVAGAKSFLEPRPHCAELEKVEELLDRFSIVRFDPDQTLGIEFKLYITDEIHDDHVQSNYVFACGEVLAKLGSLLVNVFIDAIDPAVLGEQLGGRLFANAWHARQVVRVVATHRGVLHIHLGRNARAFENAGLVIIGVVTHAAFVIDDTDVWVADELV